MIKTARAGWLEISLEAPVYILEAVSDFLVSLGAGGAIFSECAKPRPGYELLTGFLPNAPGLEFKLARLKKYLKQLKELFPEEEFSELKTTSIIDQDWINQWRESVAPAQVSKRFWVVPEWEEIPKQAQASEYLVIKMEPGLAFGTGYHTSTQLCLEFIEQLVPDKAESVLDFGAGTGILAIASAMLGAKRVVAVDIDPLALEVAKENITRNQLKGRIKLARAGAKINRRLSKENFELVLANLFNSELKRLRDYLAKHLKSDYYLVLSGILPEQWEEIYRYYKKAGFSLIEKKERQGWSAGLMRKS